MDIIEEGPRYARAFLYYVHKDPPRCVLMLTVPAEVLTVKTGDAIHVIRVLLGDGSRPHQWRRLCLFF